MAWCIPLSDYLFLMLFVIVIYVYKFSYIPFTFIVYKNMKFLLHISQKCSTFALGNENEVTITVNPKPNNYDNEFFY